MPTVSRLALHGLTVACHVRPSRAGCFSPQAGKGPGDRPDETVPDPMRWNEGTVFPKSGMLSDAERVCRTYRESGACELRAFASKPIHIYDIKDFERNLHEWRRFRIDLKVPISPPIPKETQFRYSVLPTRTRLFRMYHLNPDMLMSKFTYD